MQSPGQNATFGYMTEDRLTTVAFTGHRTYGGQAAAALRATVGELYARGFRTFLCGMAMGFDLAAAEAVLACRDSETGSAFSPAAFPASTLAPAASSASAFPAAMVSASVFSPASAPDPHFPHTPMPGLRLVAVIPFRGQESRFPAVDRERFRRVLAAADHSVTLSPSYHAGCYAVRNNYLVEHAALLVAWYDGSPGRHTLHCSPRFGPGARIHQSPSASRRTPAGRTDAVLTHSRLGSHVLYGAVPARTFCCHRSTFLPSLSGLCCCLLPFAAVALPGLSFHRRSVFLQLPPVLSPSPYAFPMVFPALPSASSNKKGRHASAVLIRFRSIRAVIPARCLSAGFRSAGGSPACRNPFSRT